MEETEILQERTKEMSSKVTEVKVKSDILQKNFAELNDRVIKLEDAKEGLESQRDLESK